MSNIYKRNECATFRKTKEQYGSFSNMAGGYPIIIGPFKFHTTEHLYQAMRFPQRPDIQLAVATPVSPMASKMVSRKNIELTQPKWDYLKIEIMRWCICLKLHQHIDTFGELLKSTSPMDIVEDSFKDEYWGAKPQKNDNDTLIGLNVLGELLRDTRDRYIRGGLEVIEHKPRLVTVKMMFDNQDLVDLL